MDAQLLAAAVSYFKSRIILSEDPAIYENEASRLFNERQYHKTKDMTGLQPFVDSLGDASGLHVASFISTIMQQGLFGVNTFVSSMVYVSRLKRETNILLHYSNWRVVFIVTLLIADKFLEDRPVKNSSICQIFPVLSISELNKLESYVLRVTAFNVVLGNSVFDSFKRSLFHERIDQEIIQVVMCSEFATALVSPTPVLPSPLPSKHIPPIYHRSSTPSSISQRKPAQPVVSSPYLFPISRPQAIVVSAPFYPRSGTPLIIGHATHRPSTPKRKDLPVPFAPPYSRENVTNYNMGSYKTSCYARLPSPRISLPQVLPPSSPAVRYLRAPSPFCLLRSPFHSQ